MWFEIWKTIPDFPDYSASTHGRIRRDTAKMGTWPGRMLKPCPATRRTREGKATSWRVTLHRDEEQHTPNVHSLVLKTFVGNRPEGMQCCHGDGDPSNNRLENLRWDTHDANMCDMVRHGTASRGSKQHKAKLTEADVREIKRSLARATRYGAGSELARKFGVGKTTISAIKHGRAWGWL